jgi:hypothetical protein
MLSPFARPDRLAAGLRVCAVAVRRRLLSAWWREIVLIAVLYGAYELSRGLGDVNVAAAFHNGHKILHLERVWHISPEHLLNQALEQATFLAVIASYFYSVMHYLVTPTVLVWMYRKHRAQYGFARTALALSTALGLIGYLLVPTAPPRLIAHSGLSDILADTQHWGWWGDDGSVPRGWGGLSNQFAAMPSLHVGWALWCGVLIATYARRTWVRVLGVAYPVMTTIVVMATGNHYLLDALAGAVTVGLGALLTLALPTRFVTVPMGPQTRIPGARGRASDTARPAPRAEAEAPAAPAAGSRVRCARDRQPAPASRAREDEYCGPSR